MNDLNQAYQTYIDSPTVENQEVLSGTMLSAGAAWIRQRYKNQYLRYEDVIVDTALEIWRSIKDGTCKFNPTKGMSFKTWFIMDLKRNIDNDKEREQYFVPLSPNLVAAEDRWREEKIDLERFIPMLTEKQQQVLDLFLSGYTQVEMAETLHTTQQAVQQIYERSIEALKEKMNPTL